MLYIKATHKIAEEKTIVAVLQVSQRRPNILFRRKRIFLQWIIAEKRFRDDFSKFFILQTRKLRARSFL
jgi:hypothetical protein